VLLQRALDAIVSGTTVDAGATGPQVALAARTPAPLERAQPLSPGASPEGGRRAPAQAAEGWGTPLQPAPQLARAALVAEDGPGGGAQALGAAADAAERPAEVGKLSPADGSDPLGGLNVAEDQERDFLAQLSQGTRAEVLADLQRHRAQGARHEARDNGQLDAAALARDAHAGVVDRGVGASALGESAGGCSGLDELRGQMREWASLDERALSGVEPSTTLGRLGAVTRELASARELESLEVLVRSATRVLGPLARWRPTLLSWLNDVDDAVVAQVGAPLAQARHARVALLTAGDES
jgi:hypothetical protein